MSQLNSLRYKVRRFVIRGVVLIMMSNLLYATLSTSFYLNKTEVINALQQHYGERAAKRGEAWFRLLSRSNDLNETEKLNKVNVFFNHLHFVSDLKLWGDKNYWSTPLEFIGVNGGDCEDFAIAKYFSLLELGVPDEKMRITMVKALKYNQYHMVVAYYDTPEAVPLILDNLIGTIKPATERTDLLPIYSFNGKQLWLNKKKGQGVAAGESQRIKRWSNLNERMGLSRMRQPILRME